MAPAASSANARVLGIHPQTIVATDRAGYAVTPARVQRVSAAWTQPSADCTAKTTYATFDVSIDGTRRPFRVGTALECHGGRATSYGFIGGPRGRVSDEAVRPGDRMRASIEVHRTNFTYSLEDDTAGWA